MTKLEIPLTEKLSRLRSLLFLFDKSFEEEKICLLDELSLCNYSKPHLFKQFHHLLMGMMAYPGSKAILDKTKKTMCALLAQTEKNIPLQQKLSGTGFLHTAVECNFSYAKARYLTEKFPNQISIHSASSTIETQKAVLKLLLPNVEYSSIHEGEKDLKKRLAQFHLNKNQTDLEWLLSLIGQSTRDAKAKAFIYNQLGIFIQWQINSENDSVSFLRGTNLPVYFHTKAIEKKTELREIIKQQLPAPVRLSLNQKQQLIHSAKMTLTYLYRETEPFSNANEEDITLFQLDKGLSVALFGSRVDKRYSLESYIGYLVLKNNIPVSYGGGWVFGERSQFGINILESFRGGESGLIICELLRVYHQYFGVTRFVVKPYQFGLHNMEAIKTGAFWFYYKLGFRPEDKELKELALKEELAKQKDPQYKSEIATLKRYTKSNLALTLSVNSYPDYDCEELSKKITSYINTRFNGNRRNALTVCFKKLKEHSGIDTKDWKPEDIEYAKQVSVLFCLKPNAKQWMKKNSRNIARFIQLKSAKTELPWVKHLQSFRAFWE
jgi:hypothetical protein